MQLSASTPESPPRVVGRPFAPGRSGNASGRPKKTPPERQAEALAKAKTPMAMRKLVAMIEDPKTTEAGRLRAIEQLLDRGLGKPVAAPESDQLANYTFVIQQLAPCGPVPGVISSNIPEHVCQRPRQLANSTEVTEVAA